MGGKGSGRSAGDGIGCGKYGMLKHQHPRLYRLWYGIRERCNNPDGKWFAYYGGRGIKMCEQWDDARVFVADIIAEIGLPPDGFSLDRIDNDVGYCPGNVRWADHVTQMLNRRPSRLWKPRTKKQTLTVDHA